MNLVLIKLLIAHLIGDFFLQPGKWVIEKEARKLRSAKLYIHVLIHGLLTYLLLADWSLLVPVATLMVIHGVIDALKLSLQKPDTKRAWFFADQALHILSILAFWWWYQTPQLDFSFLSSHVFWQISLSVLFLTYPASIAIKTLIAKWTPNEPLPGNVTGIGSLESAGKYIGIIERLLVFLFVVTQHYEAVGFLIAAKSIFRFGDLKEGNDLKFTEYVLIGTLLSFGIAISVAELSIR